MNKSAKNPGQRGRVGKNTFVTKSGKAIKIHHTIGDRMRARREQRAMKKAAYLATLPKGRIKRFFARLHPKRLYKYWFSREGGIMALKILGIGTVAGFLMLIGIFAYFRKDLPNLKSVSGEKLGGSIRYYDRSGKTLLWEDYDAVKRIPIQDKEIAQHMKDATVAIEDKDFFKHGGFDVRGIMRAGVNNVTGAGGTQGGSTITQQVVKLNQNWTRDRTYTRKVKELILAVEMERSYSKQEILAGYLNSAPYGNVQYGVEAASRDYFGKSSKDLTLDEAAFLAAIPKSPSYYSPYGSYYKANPDETKPALIGRQHYILDLMAQQGMITPEQRDEAKKVDTLAKKHDPQPKYAGIQAPWFVLTAKKQLEEKYGDQTVRRGGWVVTTTLDLGLQKTAEEQVAKGMAQVKRQGGDVAAFAAEDVTNGQMVALVGGPDTGNYANPTTTYGQFNYATTPLPPGSSYKPYDYAALIEHSTNFGAGSVLYDSQGPVDGYPCTDKRRPKDGGNCINDYDFRFPGPMTLRYALGGSRNVPAVKAMAIAGVDKTITTSEKLGLKSGYKCYQPGDETLTKETQCYTSSAIGDGAFLHLDENVHGYASLSRNGNNIPQTYILKIVDAQNKTIDEWKQSKGEQAVRQDTAYIVSDMLSDPNASYFSAGLKPHRFNTKQGQWKFAMKTGTTNDAKDAWMMGYSTKYSAGVWVGYHTRERAMSGSMETMTLPIWRGWMQSAHQNQTPVERVKPSGIQTLPAFVVRTHVGVGSVEPSPANDIYPSWYKQPTKKNGSNQTIDQVSNKLATSCTPERAKKQVNNSDANTFSGDKFVGGGNTANTSQNDDVHNCNDAKPSITVTATGCNVVATISGGTHPISSAQFQGTVNFMINGQTIKTENVSDSPASVSYTAPGGTSSVTAVVVDSVLYDASDTVNLDCGGGSAGGPFSLTVSSSGNNRTFVWTGNQGITGVYRKSNDALLCIGTISTPNSCSANVSGGTTVYAKDNVDNRTELTL